MNQKTIPCPKCKYIDTAKETCPACGGKGVLTLTRITKKKEEHYLFRKLPPLPPPLRKFNAH